MSEKIKVILKKDLKIGGTFHKAREIVSVTEGYARNFLLPKKVAVIANDAAMDELAKQKEIEEKNQQKELEEAKKIKETIDNKPVDVYAKGGSGGKLFGSITSKDVADAIYRTFEIAIDKKKVKLNLEDAKTVDSFGTYPYKVKLNKDVVASIRVNVKELTEEIKEMLKKQGARTAQKI